VLAGAPGAFDAAAFHCYSGTPDQMAGIAVPPIVTECTGTKSSWSEAFAWDARHLVADSIAAGSTGLLTWNLALDPEGGPRDVDSADGCSSCRGLLTVDGTDVEPGPEFYVLAHLARAADPGARVVGSSATEGISAAAFDNPDGTVGVIAFNGTDQDRVIGVEITGSDQVRRPVRAGELLTVRIAG
jgi:glucosylceramidase